MSEGVESLVREDGFPAVLAAVEGSHGRVRPLSCGGELWGHGGSTHGYETFGGVTDDGRAATLAAVAALSSAVAAEPEGIQKAHQHGPGLVGTAVCE
ncbi:hypothetical protein [Streptomyces diacarni]|uniref:hypothetical protein n=1 Tax=Streptomyces diacarni TaxID=2800381 RepID=UPI003F4D34D1